MIDEPLGVYPSTAEKIKRLLDNQGSGAFGYPSNSLPAKHMILVRAGAKLTEKINGKDVWYGQAVYLAAGDDYAFKDTDLPCYLMAKGNRVTNGKQYIGILSGSGKPTGDHDERPIFAIPDVPANDVAAFVGLGGESHFQEISPCSSKQIWWDGIHFNDGCDIPGNPLLPDSVKDVIVPTGKYMVSAYIRVFQGSGRDVQNCQIDMAIGGAGVQYFQTSANTHSFREGTECALSGLFPNVAGVCSVMPPYTTGSLGLYVYYHAADTADSVLVTQAAMDVQQLRGFDA